MSQESKPLDSELAYERARSMHAARCRRVGILDAAKIDLYWDGCAQEKLIHRAMAEIVREQSGNSQ